MSRNHENLMTKKTDREILEEIVIHIAVHNARHEQLDVCLKETHQAVYGNGKKGLIATVSAHAWAIGALFTLVVGTLIKVAIGGE